jgi:hypothetical protein
MRRHALAIGLAFGIFAAFSVFLGWAFYKASTAADGARTLGPIWPYALGGVVIVAALAGFLIWLGAYAARHGHEDRR